MKITFAANHGELGGGEVMLLAMVEVARDAGHEVTVVAPDGPREVIDEALALGVRAVGIHGSGAAYLSGLRRWDAKEREGLLWCNGLRPAFATSGRKNRVVALHQLPTGPQAIAAKAAMLGAQLVTVPSEWMRTEMDIHAHVLTNWTQIDPAPREFRGFPTDRPIRVGFLGRVTRDKGILVLTEALHVLQIQSAREFHLVVGGETRFASDEEAAEVREALNSLDPAPEMLGWVDREEFFSQIDLAVFPSIFPESFGLVAAEAMAFGVPIVVTDAGALADVAGIDEEYVAIPGDARTLANVVQAAVSGITSDDVAAARARWETEFSPRAGRERFRALLNDLARSTL